MKKRIIAFLCLCVMVLSIFPCVPEKALAAEEFYELKNGQVITLKNASSGWFMNLQHGTDANGTKINVYPWDETPPYTQKYKVSLNADGSFKLATLCAPSRFVDVRRYSKPLAESQGIVIWAEDGDTNKHLRLKKVGDKVAIVFANNTNLCIAPSSPTAAKTTQTQLIVRKLDATKPEMLWTVCDKNGDSLRFDEKNKIYGVKITHCASQKVLKKVNDRLMLVDSKDVDDKCCFFYSNSNPLDTLSVDYYYVNLAASNGALVWYSPLETATNPVKLIEVRDGVFAITTTVNNKTFAIDVTDGSTDKPLQTWEFDRNNSNQLFYVEVFDASSSAQKKYPAVTLDVPFFCQRADEYKNYKVNGSNTIGNAGCAVCSVAMLENFGKSTITPTEVCDKIGGVSMGWNTFNLTQDRSDLSLQHIYELLSSGKPVIIQLKKKTEKKTASSYHYIVAVGIKATDVLTEDEILVHDPWLYDGAYTTLSRSLNPDNGSSYTIDTKLIYK